MVVPLSILVLPILMWRKKHQNRLKCPTFEHWTVKLQLLVVTKQNAQSVCVWVCERGRDRVHRSGCVIENDCTQKYTRLRTHSTQQTVEHIAEPIHIQYCGYTVTIPLILFLLQIKLIFAIWLVFVLRTMAGISLCTSSPPFALSLLDAHSPAPHSSAQQLRHSVFLLGVQFVWFTHGHSTGLWCR